MDDLEAYFVYLKDSLAALVEQGINDRVFPGAVIGIAAGRPGHRQKLILAHGYAAYKPRPREMRPGIFFDLASLTKPLATTLAVLSLLKEKRISLATPLAVLLETIVPADKKNITLQQLLSHCSGLPAYQPYYKELTGYSPERCMDLVISWIMREKLSYPPGAAVLYSDLGFMLLGRIVEIKSGARLHDYVADKIFNPLGLEKKLFFRPIPAGIGDPGRDEKEFAATEQCLWRRKILCGEVHDDNCHAMGGVAGHAGLFGNAEGVLRLTTFLLDQWQGRVIHPNYDNHDFRKFVQKQTGIKDNTWALGFDTPAPGCSSGGRYLSRKSIGHLGYTGTSFWIDAEKDIVMVLLTNRVHPDRNNARIKTFRPLFHDAVLRKYSFATGGIS